VSLDDDLRTFARLVLNSGVAAKSGVRAKARVLMPRTQHSSVGISRHEIQIRLRQFWNTEWTYERVTAVVKELEARGVITRRESGYRLNDESAIEALAKGEAACTAT
jgi:hypothetical protein